MMNMRKGFSGVCLLLLSVMLVPATCMLKVRRPALALVEIMNLICEAI